MDKDTILRAWKDEEFRSSLTPEQRAALPEKPTGAGGAELSDAELESAAGAGTPAVAVAWTAGSYVVSEIAD